MENQDLKVIVKEELAVSAEVLKVKGIQLGKEALEDTALEFSNMLKRIADRTDNKIDDFFNMVKPMLDKELDKIDGKEG